MDGTNFHYITNTLRDLQIKDVDNADCSVDGDYIIFTANYVFKSNADGSNVVGVSREGLYSDVALSPDGTRIAALGMLISSGDASGEIYVTNIDGSGITRLTNNAYLDRYPTWSSDGQQIAFAYDDSGVRGIAVMNADGSNQDADNTRRSL